MTDLQLALDVIDVLQAIKLTQQCMPWFSRIEAGTPLIKAASCGILTELKRISAPRAEEYGEFAIVADMKTLDGGALETKLAIDMGADCVMVSGHASDATIRHAIKTAHAYRKGIMVELDTMLPNILKRAEQVTKMGADSYEYHIGIDFRENGADPTSRRNLRLLKKLNKLNILAVAGGMNPRRIYDLIQTITPPIIVVGKAITESMHPDTIAFKCAKAKRGVKP